MRISADPQHPDYNAAMLPVNVYLNGERLNDCVFADEEGGEAIVAARDEHGNIYVVSEEIAVEVMRGQVRITPHYITAVRAPQARNKP
ncbi:hypothetical protein CR152_27835 [Massilia violaceinigra]|uniref:Uncharacterized protein n=1 Tax=Massilia violaceinigra TaxID=2045208 RepID=A0A2D2DSE7_9BURK|nr:hypothetical protein [Massilia violaceinigra]ATQ77888.1 hypothetical protein CR152_27835 [Massilia violaceinigra]